MHLAILNSGYTWTINTQIVHALLHLGTICNEINLTKSDQILFTNVPPARSSFLISIAECSWMKLHVCVSHTWSEEDISPQQQTGQKLDYDPRYMLVLRTQLFATTLNQTCSASLGPLSVESCGGGGGGWLVQIYSVVATSFLLNTRSAHTQPGF